MNIKFTVLICLLPAIIEFSLLHLGMIRSLLFHKAICLMAIKWPIIVVFSPQRKSCILSYLFKIWWKVVFGEDASPMY